VQRCAASRNPWIIARAASFLGTKYPAGRRPQRSHSRTPHPMWPCATLPCGHFAPPPRVPQGRSDICQGRAPRSSLVAAPHTTASRRDARMLPNLGRGWLCTPGPRPPIPTYPGGVGESSSLDPPRLLPHPLSPLRVTPLPPPLRVLLPDFALCAFALWPFRSPSPRPAGTPRHLPGTSAPLVPGSGPSKSSVPKGRVMVARGGSAPLVSGPQCPPTPAG
jgi:hypothetical protein